jgi:DNA processing protein
LIFFSKHFHNSKKRFNFNILNLKKLKNSILQEQIALSLLSNVGPKRMRTILKHIGSPRDFFNAKKKDLLMIPGIGEHTIRSMNRNLALQLAEPYVDFFVNSAFNTHFFKDETFPKRLNQCVDAPLLLFSKGNLDMNLPKVVSIVGTRNASDYGKRICEELIQSFVGKNILVVSGLAYGIDIYVHQLCVKHKIQTIGVLGHGLDRLYPSVHSKTARNMEENGGLLTEFLPGTNPDRENFPMRNRIVAGMTDATIVVESGIKGGSLITAELANDYNRDVFAFPGDIYREFSKGCNYLIQKDKAHLITGSKDFLKLMEWEDKKTVKTKQIDMFESLLDEEKMIVNYLKVKTEDSFDNVMYETKLSFSKLNSSLLNLEISGIIKSLPGKKYRLN